VLNPLREFTPPDVSSRFRYASKSCRRDAEATVNGAAEVQLTGKSPTESDFPGTAMV
jgi:hypothetical protein